MDIIKGLFLNQAEGVGRDEERINRPNTASSVLFEDRKAKGSKEQQD